jgi:hypothetical protein
MENLLLKYLNDIHENNVTSVHHWSIEGAYCTVSFALQEHIQMATINIWEMLIFLNKLS